MGSWGVAMRESDYGMDLLDTIAVVQLRKVKFAIFNVSEAIEVVKEAIMDEIRQANRGCSAKSLVHYFSENFPERFTRGALLIAECLADYYRSGELIVDDFVGKNYDLAEHRIKEFIVTDADIDLLLEEVRSAQSPDHALCQGWISDKVCQEWLAHAHSLQETLEKHRTN